jgi:hypothetical protein
VDRARVRRFADAVEGRAYPITTQQMIDVVAAFETITGRLNATPR